MTDTDYLWVVCVCDITGHDQRSHDLWYRVTGRKVCDMRVGFICHDITTYRVCVDQTSLIRYPWDRGVLTSELS